MLSLLWPIKEEDSRMKNTLKNGIQMHRNRFLSFVLYLSLSLSLSLFVFSASLSCLLISIVVLYTISIVFTSGKNKFTPTSTHCMI
mmetsp:Transcript_18964/g.19086  ORF Transcript_18964/g.19086 Transcript_18964/m.19086 type:complete len:86 (+) Transcript_18964:570-827(+)